MKKMGKVTRVVVALLTLTLLFGLFPIGSGNNLNKVPGSYNIKQSKNCSRLVYGIREESHLGLCMVWSISTE